MNSIQKDTLTLVTGIYSLEDKIKSGLHSLLESPHNVVIFTTAALWQTELSPRVTRCNKANVYVLNLEPQNFHSRETLSQRPMSDDAAFLRHNALHFVKVAMTTFEVPQTEFYMYCDLEIWNESVFVPFSANQIVLFAHAPFCEGDHAMNNINFIPMTDFGDHAVQHVSSVVMFGHRTEMLWCFKQYFRLLQRYVSFKRNTDSPECITNALCVMYPDKFKIIHQNT
jgi:hypothetical protein